jgi:NAD(P)-dependent dehydrogenase (short-subunit alcohol dehydrogenase family)
MRETEVSARRDKGLDMGEKIALVTGAGSGIGKAVAVALLKEGYATVLAGRRRAPLEATAQAGGTSLVAATDVADAASVEGLFRQIKERFGRLDLLFNNAGVNAPAVPVEDLPVENWHEVIAANVTGVYLCTRAAFMLMKSQTPRGGRIINNGSISAHTPRPHAVAYTTTKHGVTGLTKQTALDCRGYDIACGQIDIGNAGTPLTERMVAGVLQPDGSKRPEPRMNADDVGKAVVYMAGLGLDTNVLFMTVMANLMPFVGRG